MKLFVRKLTYSHASIPALFDVSATFAPGRLSVILGPNGAGKSTLLACLSGLLKPDSGDVTLGETGIADMPANLRARAIGLLPQSAETHWAIGSEALVALGRYPHQKGLGVSPADHAAVAAAMAATDTTAFADRSVTELSGGERARVLMARVLAGEPSWILADEPLANLDPGHQIGMLTLLRAQADAGKGVIAVLHDLQYTARFADHIVLLDKGRLVVEGTSADVLTQRNLADVYGVDAAVATGEEGALQINIKGRVAR